MSVLKAYVLHGIGDVRYETVDAPAVEKGKVIVEVKVAGICGSDIPRIYQTGAYSHPLIPGHEFSGVVVETGEGVEDSWKGRRVGVFPLIPCGQCLPCSEKHYEMCRSYDYLGSRSNGGFAEYAAVPAGNLIELPDEVSFEAASMLEPMAVAVHAMRRVFGENVADKAKKGGNVFICGLGTIGLLLFMFLRTAGFENIYVIGNKQYQKEKVISMGLLKDRYCDAKKMDAVQWTSEKTEGRGADVFFECVGKQETVKLSVELTAPGGTTMLMGNPHSDMTLEKAVYWKILRNQLTVLGTWNSSFTGESDDDWHYVLGHLRKGSIFPEKLISHRISLGELEKGFHIMRDKSEPYIKVMGCM